MVSERWIADALASNCGMEKLLKGQDGYALPNPDLDTPTFTSDVISAITIAFGHDARVMAGLLAGIQAVSRDADYSWTALYSVFDVLDKPHLFGAAFDQRAFAMGVIALVRTHELHLRSLKRWAGAQDADGCWGVAARPLAVMHKHHPLHLQNVQNVQKER